VRLLLDTHTFIWWDNGELPKKVESRIRQAEEIYVSAATAWEMSIKSALGKLVATACVADAIQDYGFLPLPVSLEHADAIRTLPAIHRDPFDRILVVQARLEDLALVSSDSVFGKYPVSVVWQ
jgi:PIN domain nuclease of toxin-antitoxin system